MRLCLKTTNPNPSDPIQTRSCPSSRLHALSIRYRYRYRCRHRHRHRYRFFLGCRRPRPCRQVSFHGGRGGGLMRRPDRSTAGLRGRDAGRRRLRGLGSPHAPRSGGVVVVCRRCCVLVDFFLLLQMGFFVDERKIRKYPEYFSQCFVSPPPPPSSIVVRW